MLYKNKEKVYYAPYYSRWSFDFEHFNDSFFEYIITIVVSILIASTDKIWCKVFKHEWPYIYTHNHAADPYDVILSRILPI